MRGSLKRAVVIAALAVVAVWLLVTDEDEPAWFRRLAQWGDR